MRNASGTDGICLIVLAGHDYTTVVREIDSDFTFKDWKNLKHGRLVANSAQNYNMKRLEEMQIPRHDIR